MRTMIGIKSRKFPAIRITLSMKSVKLCSNLYPCTHSSGDSIRILHTVHTHPPKALHQGRSAIGQS